ncbi:MAG: PP2C family protein-serine/threonine phosphatase [Anaerolineales bacterium]|nr:PP2C family protein-serine/threonine phosphatase [Anaerolineales bacterium]
MAAFDPVLDGPTTAGYHREAIEQITQCVEERVYCALLGPRLCGKTLLLRFIEQDLAQLLGWTCVYIDLHKIRATTQQVFFADLIRVTAQHLTEKTGRTLSLPDENLASSAGYRAFLSDSLETLGCDLLLMFDPLEALPTDLVQALLTSLRAAYMDQQMMDIQLTVVVSGALSLATSTVGESSPFRGIARRVFIGDLSESDSETLILDFLREDGINATNPAIQKLVSATSGDVYLIRQITQYCSERVRSRTSSRLRSRDVDLIINRFLRKDVFHYAPLIEAIWLIEEDPDLLQGILQLLAEDSVPRSALPLPLSPDLDPLYLTGVVEKIEPDQYRLQNLIYHQFLKHHFSPDRVGRVLAMAGRWESAIDYLESSMLQDNQGFRSDLLPATINSMYASQDLSQAVHFLQRGLSAVFGIGKSQIWLRLPGSDRLRSIGSGDLTRGSEAGNDQEIPVAADRLEARAYRTQVAIRGQEEQESILRAFPLMVPGSQPIGVLTISEQLTNQPQVDLRERDLQMTGFLNQATRALHAVRLRRQELTLAGRVQASLLPDRPPEIPGWQIAATWKPARETSGDFYDFVPLPKGRIGIVIADVVDKGMGAALLMALSRTLIRTYAIEFPNHPEHLLQVTNQRILTDIDAGMFVTLFYGVLDPATGLLTYSNAGHPPPYLFTPGSNPGTSALPGSGMPLGVSEEANWQQGIQEIPPGAMLLLYTDGVIDAQNPQGEFLGEEGMLNIIQSQIGESASRVQEILLSTLGDFAGAEPQIDDITLMTLVRDQETGTI